MSVPFKIELTDQAKKIVAGFQSLPARIIAAIAQGMNEASQYAVAKIQSAHLTGEKGRRQAYDPSEHRLVTRTGRLRNSVWASDAQPISDTQVQGAIGSNVVYAEIHEFGGRIHHEARQMKVRHRIDARGNLVKQLKNSNLLMFAGARHKRARETTVQTKAYDVEMPERAPFRTGLEESRPTFKTVISRNIIAAWKGMAN